MKPWKETSRRVLKLRNSAIVPFLATVIKMSTKMASVNKHLIEKRNSSVLLSSTKGTLKGIISSRFGFVKPLLLRSKRAPTDT